MKQLYHIIASDASLAVNVVAQFIGLFIGPPAIVVAQFIGLFRKLENVKL